MRPAKRNIDTELHHNTTQYTRRGLALGLFLFLAQDAIRSVRAIRAIRLPIALEMGEAHEFAVTRRDSIGRQGHQPSHAELLAGIRPQDIAVDKRAMEVAMRQLAHTVQALRQIAQKTASKRIARAGRVLDIFQRIGGRGMITAVGGKEQGAI
jgi:hypothetical protein